MLLLPITFFGLWKNTDKVTSPSDFHTFISSMIRVKIYILCDSLYRHMYMRVSMKMCILCDFLYRRMYMHVPVKIWILCVWFFVQAHVHVPMWKCPETTSESKESRRELPSSGDGLHWLSCTAVFPNVNHLSKLIFRHSLKNTNLAPDAKQLSKVNREEAWPGANSSPSFRSQLTFPFWRFLY